jgi:hypothetical protein
MRYLAPEVLAGGAAGVGSDLFALGRLLEEVVAHEKVADGEALGTLIAHLTEADPERRPGSAQDAAVLLETPTPTSRAGPLAGKGRGTDGGATAATSVLRPRSDRTRLPRRPRLQLGRDGALGSRLQSLSQSAARSMPTALPRLRGPLIAVVVAAVIIGAVALARSGGGAPRRTSPPPPSAPLSQQLVALQRSLSQASR